MTKVQRSQLKESIRAILNEPAGLRLDTPFQWVVSGVTMPSTFFEKLTILMPFGSILYFEGCAISPDARLWFERHVAPKPAAIARDTISPKPACFHVVFSDEVVRGLCEMVATWEVNELSQFFDHIKGYRENKLLFHFHDAFFNDLSVSDLVPEPKVKEFCSALAATYRRELIVQTGQDELRALLARLEADEQARTKKESMWKRLWRKVTKEV